MNSYFLSQIIQNKYLDESTHNFYTIIFRVPPSSSLKHIITLSFVLFITILLNLFSILAIILLQKRLTILLTLIRYPFEFAITLVQTCSIRIRILIPSHSGLSLLSLTHFIQLNLLKINWNLPEHLAVLAPHHKDDPRLGFFLALTSPLRTAAHHESSVHSPND